MPTPSRPTPARALAADIRAQSDRRKPLLDHLQFEAIGRDLAFLSRRAAKRPLVLFFGRPTFSDNTKYLYLEALSAPRDYEVRWCTMSPSLAAQLQAAGLPVLNLMADVGASLRLLMEASVAVFCENMNAAFGTNNMFPGALAGARTIQLWHGVSVKQLDLMLVPHLDPAEPGFRNAVKLATRTDYLLSTSRALDPFWVQAFGASQLIRAGHPRNAVMVRPPTAHEFIGAELPPDQQRIMDDPSRRRLLVVPTWQRGAPLFISTAECHRRLAAWAAQHHTTVFVKSHPFRHGAAGRPEDIPGLLHHLDPGVDVYPWLSRFDALVTDYSSIMFDFLFTGKPILTLDVQLESHGGFEPDWSLIPDTPFRYVFDATSLEAVLDAHATDAVDAHPLAASQRRLREQLFETDARHASADLLRLIDACNQDVLERSVDVLAPALLSA